VYRNGPAVSLGNCRGVPVGEREDNAIRRQVFKAIDGVRGEVGFALFAVGHDRAAERLEPRDGVAYGFVVPGVECVPPDPAGRVVGDGGE
jgi:hypothetical protein